MKAPPDTPIPLLIKSPLFYLLEVVRPGGLELPTFWFVAIRVKMLNALFGVAYGLETPFFPQLAAPNSAPKTELNRTCTEHFMCSFRKAEFDLGGRQPYPQRTE